MNNCKQVRRNWAGSSDSRGTAPRTSTWIWKPSPCPVMRWTRIPSSTRPGGLHNLALEDPEEEEIPPELAHREWTRDEFDPTNPSTDQVRWIQIAKVLLESIVQSLPLSAVRLILEHDHQIPLSEAKVQHTFDRLANAALPGPGYVFEDLTLPYLSESLGFDFTEFERVFPDLPENTAGMPYGTDSRGGRRTTTTGLGD